MGYLCNLPYLTRFSHVANIQDQIECEDCKKLMSVGLWAECAVISQGYRKDKLYGDLYIKGWLNKVNNWATLWEFICLQAISHSF